MQPIHRFDEVHSVSDLHLGGKKGFQVFDRGPQLGNLIDHLRKRPKERRVGLVINGDFVDFLAEDPAACFDPVGAGHKLARIAADPAFEPVFKALRRFVRTRGRTLVVTLGNHDLELAMPWVRQRFLDEISGGNAAARGRIILSLDGSGYSCTVGGRQVLFVHGNEVDTWNLCDYERLRKIGRDLTQGREVEDWAPNAGARMVIEVMNEIKSKYPFVDLLKPETEAAVPVLLAIEPKLMAKMRNVLPLVGRKVVDATRHRFGFLSAEEQEPREAERAATGKLQEILERQRMVAEGGSDVDELLARVEDRIEKGQTAFETLDSDRNEEYLGVGTAIWKAIRGDKKSEVVREAFEGLKEDQSFARDTEDPTFRDLDELIDPRIDYLIAGHTHLERELPRKYGGGTYFNTGTWIRLMRLDADLLSDADEFGRVFEKLSSATMAELDGYKYKIGGEERSLVLRKPAMVSIATTDRGVQAELLRVNEETGLPEQPANDAAGGEA